MTPRERLQNVQDRLIARGVQDVKFFWNEEALKTASLDEVMTDVSEALEAHLDGRTTPLPPFNDKPVINEKSGL